MTITAGTRLGHYEVLSPLGRGGMGEVYLAQDSKLRRKVALKVLGEELAGHPERLRRFAQEAEAAAALSHPNVAHIYEVNQQDGLNFIAMEYVEGETLRRRISRGGTSLREALDVSAQVAAALAAAHQAGVVHRDIKPENIVIRPDGYVKVLDFGLAKLIDLPAASSDTEAPTVVKANTDPGTVLGTVNYMSPEQARGKPVDARSDIFSLGVVIYEMLTGRAPFEGETPSDVIAALLGREAPPLASLAPDAPADLRHVVNKALRKDREERYQSVKSLLADLKALRRELELATDLERGRSPEAISGRGGTPGAVVAALPEVEESDGLDLAHVLFCDIVGYSLQPIDRQTEMMRRLQEIVRQTEAYRRAEASQQLVRLPAGDGMALAFLYDLSAPVRCAFDIARALKSHPDIRLRIGVHSGPVFRSADINANRNVVGSGINLAQRVMDCGDAGHILVSRHVAEVLGEVSQWQAYLHDLGEVEVKHGVRLHLSNLYDDEIGNAETPAKVKGQHAASTPPDTIPTAGSAVSEIKQHKRGIAVALSVVLLAATGLASWFFFLRLPHVRQYGAIAVMPFANEGADPAGEYLSDGISESLINTLSQLPQLKVIARSSSFRYRGKEVDVREAARELGVGAVVTGRVVQRGDSLQVSVEVVDAADGTQMWGERYSRRAADVQAVQSEIAREVAERLRLRLTGVQEQQLAKRATDNPEAYQLYLNGEFYFRKGGFENGKRALDYFHQATALDPNFALAWTGVSKAYISLGANGLLDPKEASPRAKEAARKAVGLDESLAEAHLVLGTINQFEWDWKGAESEYRRAVELNPSLAIAHNVYSQYLSDMGRHAEALAETKRAQELDPLRVRAKAQEGMALYFARRYDEAIQKLQNLIKLEPDYVMHAYLGYTYAAKGMYGEAIEAYQKANSIEGETTSTLCYLGHALARSGKRGEAQAILDKLKRTKEYVSPAELAILYAGLGDKEGALMSLERAYEAHDLQMQYLKVDPSYDSLRSEPRFQDLMRKVGLPQ